MGCARGQPCRVCSLSRRNFSGSSVVLALYPDDFNLLLRAGDRVCLARWEKVLLAAPRYLLCSATAGVQHSSFDHFKLLTSIPRFARELAARSWLSSEPPSRFPAARLFFYADRNNTANEASPLSLLFKPIRGSTRVHPIARTSRGQMNRHECAQIARKSLEETGQRTSAVLSRGGSARFVVVSLLHVQQA